MTNNGDSILDLMDSSRRPRKSPSQINSRINDHGIRIYIAEEQQILREAYQSFFSPQPDIIMIGSSSDTSTDGLLKAIESLRPDIVLIGIKFLQTATVEKLNLIRELHPKIGVIVLSAYYDIKGIKALRQFSRGTSIGCAYLLKHTVDTVSQLTQVILAVAEGRIILDPAIMEILISAQDAKNTSLKELTPRELEVLSWMAKGYKNNVIADVLCLETTTVERHINSIYSKIGNCPEETDDAASKHARVHAVMFYLKATGMLPAEESAVD